MSDRSGKGQMEAHFSKQAAQYEAIAVPLFTPLAQRLVKLAELKPGARVLDVASGTGLAAFLAAEAVGPEGQVLATDVSDGMLEVARQKAAEIGLANISFEVADAEGLELPESSFDAALCALGLFLMRQAPKVLQSIRSALVPGGRFACSVWGSAEAHDPFGIFFGTYAKYQPSVAPPGMGRSGVLEGLLRGAGFVNLQIRRDLGSQVFAEPEAFWEFYSSVGGPAAMTARLSTEDQRSFRDDVLRAVAAKQTPDGYRLRTEIVYGTGERAATIS